MGDRLAIEETLDPHAVILRQAAIARGIKATTVMTARRRGSGRVRPWLRLEIAGRTYFYRAGVLRYPDGEDREIPGFHINSRAIGITADKSLTARTLRQAGLSVPRGESFSTGDVEAALAYAAALGGPVCVKPTKGQKSMLVFPNLGTPEAIEAAIRCVATRYQNVLVEQHVRGEVVRYFYVRPAIVGVMINRLAQVTGNGRDTIGALIAERNRIRAERALPSHPEMVVGEAVLAHLRSLGLDLQSVPAAGQTVTLCLTSGRDSGTESSECRAEVHPSYEEAVAAGCAAIPGLRIAAIDVMVADPHQPAEPGNHWFLDLNSSPGLQLWHDPWAGRVQDVAGAMLDYLSRPRPASA